MPITSTPLSPTAAPPPGWPPRAPAAARAFVLAIGEGHARDIDAACAHGHDLVAITARLSSDRLRNRLTDLLRALDTHAAELPVRWLREAAHPVLTARGGVGRLR